MPLRYRVEIGPHFHSWATSGFQKYAAHPATQAALVLADELMRYKAVYGFTYERTVENYMTNLRDCGVTPADVLIRVVEYVGFMEANPARIRSQREEDFALARGVLHLIPYKLSGRPEGARMLNALGPMVREACYLFALGLARKLKDDTDKRAALMRRAGNFGDLS
jgi:hypothetical protein